MKYFVVLAFLAVAFAATLKKGPETELSSPFNADSEIEVINGDEERIQEIAPSFILSWQLRRFIRKFQKQMPCGFPQYGIPPLAPLKKSEASVHFESGIFETLDLFTRLRVDGLDDFKINKFKLNVIFKKITFDFTFNNIRATAPFYSTDTILDALNQLGLSVQYEGDGSLEFGLKKLRIAGTLKYKIPLLWGSIKILSLKTTISLGECESNITGFLGDGALNSLMNKKLESAVLGGINNNQQLISESIENNLVPYVNSLLKGNDFWTLIDLILSGDDGASEDDEIVTNCVAPEDPWA
ncbi:uncharacterized protein LOC105665409 [Ceratitis capitata]|uniref:(Mediterranean fruit fly) hypothetical protein n=1 Tax=Ceratitis capitata TaxID=7213 RepID=W8CE14_CERCA|nr:uncharacterized protein LOC105665409 [Ceratitis capitata]CAD6997373.1 unnamed protein product [Ceratitis capitata]